MQAALNISSPVSSFMPFVEACCDAVGCDCAMRIAGSRMSRRNALGMNFIVAEDTTKRDDVLGVIYVVCIAKKTEIILKKIELGK
jgi:hypothetical protein